MSEERRITGLSSELFFPLCVITGAVVGASVNLARIASALEKIAEALQK